MRAELDMPFRGEELLWWSGAVYTETPVFASLTHHRRMESGYSNFWIPAFAGMTNKHSALQC
jgi:hypothetical protein